MENKENNSPELKKKSHWNIRPYLAIALTAFLVITLSIIFFFLIYRYNGFAAGWRKLTVILQPIIIGIVIAYLINPIMMFFEKYLLRWIEPKIQKKDKAKKLCRSLATFGALAVFIMIIAILLILLIPQLAESIQGLVVTLPGEVQELIDKVNGILKNDSEIADMFENTLLHATDYLRNWAMNDLLPKSNQYLTSITSGLISIFKVLLNIVVGLIVSIYLLFSKETFIGQFKKLTYALFKPKRANIIIETARKSNEIFGGFISGKILDSTIIGIICYIVLLIMKNAICRIGQCDRRCYECDSVLWTVYRCSTGIYHYRTCQSVAGTLFPDRYFYPAAGRRKYHRTNDLRRFHRTFSVLGSLCDHGRRRIVRICGNAPWSSGLCRNLLHYTEGHLSLPA